MSGPHPLAAGARPPRPEAAPRPFRLPARAREPGAWIHLPEAPGAAPPLVAVHGIGRDARAQALTFAAGAGPRAVVAPQFDAARWPAYQRAVIRGRADIALIELMEALRTTGLWRGRRFALVGYSGGAQFAHRFALLHPELVDSLVVVSAGWYTFPDDAPFPFGLARRPASKTDWGPRIAARLDRFLRIPIRVCVGDRDVARDADLRRGPEIDAQQGTDRLARARRWTEAVNAAAAARGLPAPATLHLLEGAGHDFGECVAAGLVPLAAALRRSPCAASCGSAAEPGGAAACAGRPAGPSPHIPCQTGGAPR